MPQLGLEMGIGAGIKTLSNIYISPWRKEQMRISEVPGIVKRILVKQDPTSRDHAAKNSAGERNIAEKNVEGMDDGPSKQ